MNGLDIGLLIPLLFGAYHGFKKGLIYQVATLVALIAGIWGALEFSFYTESLLDSKTELDKSYLPLTAFALTFLGIVIGIHLLAKLLEKILSLIALSLVNKLLGTLFGVVKWAIILSFLLSVITSINEEFKLLDRELLASSMLFEPLASLAPLILPLIKDTSWYQEFFQPELESAQESIATTPGSFFPSISSSNAPPPVDT